MRIINKYKYRLAKKKIENDEPFKNKLMSRLLDNVCRHGTNLPRLSDDQLRYYFRSCCILDRFEFTSVVSFYLRNEIIEEQERRLFNRDNVINFGSYANDRKR